ncbi:hypothetical protein [Pseudoalteromonas lipolytica]
MKKKLIVHIGTPKTGSSYLQELCIKNYDKLLAAGILYPGVESGEFTKKANIPINASHILSLFFSECSKEEVCNSIVDNLNTLFSFNVSTALISDETLSAYTPNYKQNFFIFECLIEVCTLLDIELLFVGYYRHPSKYLPSHWAQLVKKHKETSALSEFVAQNKIPYWNNLILLSRLYENVAIYSYDDELETEGGIVTSFFKEVGVDPRGFSLLADEIINPSLSLNCLTALRLINVEYENEIIESVESILTNAKPKVKLSKPRLSQELENFVNELYKEELYQLSLITSKS